MSTRTFRCVLCNRRRRESQRHGGAVCKPCTRVGMEILFGPYWRSREARNAMLQEAAWSLGTSQKRGLRTERG